jgi:phosphoribosyl-ATP pyrophosphohydrolase/phosphoribosyl-AMP cyclohydrolase/histidinol dehydrogenase
MRSDPVEPQARDIASNILASIREEGEVALRRFGEQFGDVKPGGPLTMGRDAMKAAFDRLPADQQGVLQRTAGRIRSFAESQKASLAELTVDVMGGTAGHSIAAVENAGCYAPGGRYPLPSSVLMTCIPARVAGCKQVWVASPHPDDATMAAAYVAGADNMLCVGGAQAIAAFACGAGPVPACDAIVGPGNKFVTAAKSLVAGRVAIDMLAGPSEVLIIADADADPQVVAADLLAQAEHDTAARPILVTTCPELVGRVEAEMSAQLAKLPQGNQDVARSAVEDNGFVVVVPDLEAAVAVSDVVAPEHLEVHTAKPQAVASQCQHYGAVFIGQVAAEVLGDYGAGPNHTLPTSGTARSSGGCVPLLRLLGPLRKAAACLSWRT